MKNLWESVQSVAENAILYGPRDFRQTPVWHSPPGGVHRNFGADGTSDPLPELKNGTSSLQDSYFCIYHDKGEADALDNRYFQSIRQPR